MQIRVGYGKMKDVDKSQIMSCQVSSAEDLFVFHIAEQL